MALYPFSKFATVRSEFLLAVSAHNHMVDLERTFSPLAKMLRFYVPPSSGTMFPLLA